MYEERDLPQLEERGELEVAMIQRRRRRYHVFREVEDRAGSDGGSGRAHPVNGERVLSGAN